MASSATATAALVWSAPRVGGRLCLLLALILTSTAVLVGCATHPAALQAVKELPPLQTEGHTLETKEVAALAPTPDLLALNQPMREFVARYAADGASERQRLMSLHGAVRGAGALDLQYDAFAEGTAQQVFERGSANCLSYANLFVALAREAGLDARYQWLEVRPQWSRVGDRVLVGLHVNVLVRMRKDTQFMVDIDPLPARDIAGSRQISDTDAAALYHSNIAMSALANEELEAAWLNAVRALQLSPAMSHLWVNMGAVYRQAGQYPAAENSYLQALALDGWQHSAMSNLVVLYGLQGRQQEQAYWRERVENYRETNPYFYAELGDMAGERGDWREALAQYDQAIALLPGDSQLLYTRGLIYYRLDDLDAAARDMTRAIELATLRSDIDSYQAQLEEVRKARLAGL